MALERRRFLQLSAGAAASAFSLQVLPKPIRDALAVAPAVTTGTISDVQHVVILMQENRSFDHYLGSLRGVRGFDDPRTVALPGGKSVWQQPNRIGSAKYTLPFKLDVDHTAAQCMSDIDHSWRGSYSLWKNYDAWVQTKGSNCMGYFERSALPFYYSLADAFTVCDAYYCSLFGPTNPNRMHLFTGTSGLTVGNSGTQVVNNADDGNWTADMSKDSASFAGYAWSTYAERLQAAGVSWKVYQEYDNYGDNALQYFKTFRKLGTSSWAYQRGRAWAAGSNAGNAASSRGEYLIGAFANDVRNGTLPQVSWLVAPFIMTEHPSASPAYGESLTARLLEALAANPEVWSRTVFIINYDENGGFFDHQPAHLPAIDRNLGLSTVDVSTENYHGAPLGLGVRVPMFVVSPWSKGGFVNSQVFDHTSVIRFLEQRFGVAEPNISAWRRAVCGDLTSTLEFADPDYGWPALPDTSGYMLAADASCTLAQPHVPARQAMPRQERGQRPSCALPYALDVRGRIDAAAGKYWLDFFNTGSAGAGFNVYSGNRTDGPWYYTLERGKSLSDYWSAMSVTGGVYDLRAFGPNGFLREFKGDMKLATGNAPANPEVETVYDSANGRLILRLSNKGSATCHLVVRPNRYSSEAARTYTLVAGASLDDPWIIRSSGHWYDLAVTSDSDGGWLRRIAGHMETGYASVSDPAIGAS